MVFPTSGLEDIRRDTEMLVRGLIRVMCVLGNQPRRLNQWCSNMRDRTRFTLWDLDLLSIPDNGPLNIHRDLAGNQRELSLGCLCWETKVAGKVDDMMRETMQKWFNFIVTSWIVFDSRRRTILAQNCRTFEEIWRGSTEISSMGGVCWDIKVAGAVDGVVRGAAQNTSYANVGPDLLPSPDNGLMNNP